MRQWNYTIGGFLQRHDGISALFFGALALWLCFLAVNEATPHHVVRRSAAVYASGTVHIDPGEQSVVLFRPGRTIGGLKVLRPVNDTGTVVVAIGQEEVQ